MSIKNGFNSDQDWEKINEEWQRSGLLMSEYCRANNINKQNLYEWRYKNKKSNLTKKPGAVASREKKEHPKVKEQSKPQPQFFELHPAADAEVASKKVYSVGDLKPGTLRITTAYGSIIEVAL